MSLSDHLRYLRAFNGGEHPDAIYKALGLESGIMGAETGYRPVRDMMHVEEKWATHNEAAWARRLPNALRFFMINTTAYSHKTAVS